MANSFNKLPRARVFRLFFASRADVDFPGFGFFVTDDEHEWDFLQGVLADFGVHLLVAGVDFDADVRFAKLRSHFVRILDMPLGDRD
jgi:hypothetical protein